MRFDGKVVLVTGAAQGIGKATALKFASEGAKLVLCDVKLESLNEISGELISGKCRVFKLCCKRSK